MGSHHDLELTAPRMFKPQLLADADRCDFDLAYSGRTEITFTNNLTCTVYVADRLGGILTVRPSVGCAKFGIRISRYFGKNTIASYQSDNFVTRVGKARPSGEDHAILKNYTHRDVGAGHSRLIDKTQCFMVGIDEKDFTNAGGSIYVAESDMVLSLSIEGAVHPGSPMEVLKRISAGVKSNDAGMQGNCAHVSIRIVDNKGRTRDRFINLAGEVHRIKAVKSPNCKDGIYVFRDGLVNEQVVEFDNNVEFYELTEEVSGELGLFKSYEAALHWAEDLRESTERELVQKKGDLMVKKVDLEAESLTRKDQFEDRSLSRKDHYDDRGTVRKDYFDERVTVRKDYYDDSSTRRKDTSDELKWILGITATLLGAVALFRK